MKVIINISGIGLWAGQPTKVCDAYLAYGEF